MLNLILITATTVFAMLFVWLLSDIKKDSFNREERLLNHIEKQGEALERVTDTIEKMDVRLSHIEQKVNNNHKE
ncbi:holin [Bacillus toyonensis]|uniref:holin n=1 Tax=Bacillus toyonensis TaxID=155322 RepID=UPI000BF5DF7F|nr:holin [Bacillus toyonensis]PFY74022.1 holin [Bacillus toyonensis]